MMDRSSFKWSPLYTQFHNADWKHIEHFIIDINRIDKEIERIWNFRFD